MHLYWFHDWANEHTVQLWYFVVRTEKSNQPEVGGIWKCEMCNETSGFKTETQFKMARRNDNKSILNYSNYKMTFPFGLSNSSSSIRIEQQSLTKNVAWYNILSLRVRKMSTSMLLIRARRNCVQRNARIAWNGMEYLKF